MSSEGVKIGFIGAGRMAQAIAKGFIASGAVTPDNIIASASRPESEMLKVMQSFGIGAAQDNMEVVEKSDVIFLSVKPHLLRGVLVQIRGHVCGNKLLVSIAAGVTIANIEELLPLNARVIRVMPNTPSFVRAGFSIICVGTHCTDTDAQFVVKLMNSVGETEVCPERLIDAAGSIHGCGVAYCFVAIEALADGGVKMGLPRSLAMRLASQTLLGAGKMCAEAGKHPGQLKDEVCSPGGSTITAIHELEKSAFRGSLMTAVEAATKKNADLGKS